MKVDFHMVWLASFLKAPFCANARSNMTTLHFYRLFFLGHYSARSIALPL